MKKYFARLIAVVFTGLSYCTMHTEGIDLLKHPLVLAGIFFFCFGFIRFIQYPEGDVRPTRIP